MCQERGGKNTQAISTHLIHTWYMKHASDFRGGWRWISFARTKTKKKSAFQSQAEMAKAINLQRTSARAASMRSENNLPSLGCTETSQWMFRTFNSLCAKRKSRSKDHRLSTRLKSLIRSNTEDPVSSSSLTELIPACSVDFDLTNLAISPDSDFQTTGQPPSRRSSASFFSPKTCDSNGVLPGSVCPRSPFRPGRHHRRKRSIFRAARVALTGGRGNRAGGRRQVLSVAPMSTGIGIGRSRYSLSDMGMTTPTSMIEKQHPTSPVPVPLEKNPSRCITITMDTSSSPCKSSPCKSSNASWPENYDMLTETISTSSWSLRTDLDSPLRAAKLDSPRERNLDSTRARKFINEEWRNTLDEADKQDYLVNGSKKPSSPVAHPISTKNIQTGQASAIKGVRYTGKEFHEAIVDIILDNDVNDLVDLEEFLQGYFRLNPLYQDIIQQFFNDLSDDLVNPKVSRAPSVFARLAAANQKSMAAAKGGGRSAEL